MDSFGIWLFETHEHTVRVPVPFPDLRALRRGRFWSNILAKPTWSSGRLIPDCTKGEDKATEISSALQPI
ncbi:hypothetical protein GJ744_002620 [Endocarpon pusillum]|uniref:Uncharacterized protein n=1 Tax=Endocarpon pusillum TaxID=364733 RepID=A0A8H7ABN6_9EURO|nr:hypothetical protein GJ744_002620 [Endocarpon pusillum]